MAKISLWLSKNFVYWTMVISTAIGVAAVCFYILIFNHFESLIGISAESSAKSPYGSDVNQTAQALYQSICGKGSATSCYIEIHRDKQLLATAPVARSETRIWTTTHRHVLEGFSPTLEMVVEAEPSRTLVLRMLSVSLLIFLIWTMAGAAAWYFWESHQKNSEIEVLRREAMISEVIARAAHDIRSPVMALRSCASLVDGEEHRNFILKISDRITGIAEEMLRARREILTHTQEVKSPSPSDQPGELTHRSAYCKLSQTATIGELLKATKDIVSEFSNYPQLRNVRFAIEDKVSLRHKIYLVDADLGLYKRIIANLLNNSVEALGQKNGDGDQVVDDGINHGITGHIDVKLKWSNRQIEVLVHDDGPGAPQEVVEQLFEKHFSSGKASGNGLGLYSAKRIIESWGGKILASSGFKKGFSVLIQLPLSDDQFRSPAFAPQTLVVR